ncbi:MAG: aromatic-L-amino-acid/L-tryptophan decarboxylase, partial [Pyrinomonadaceae bacterium]|nr:aromatic-L-amino-acid/L-tryptophan decarboxylase [Pyrinomonadaceae bacterium]
GIRNGADYGVQLGRRFRSLKLWMILRYFGHDGLAARIREHCRLARLFASWVEADPRWELLAPVPLSVVCFRAVPPPNAAGETDDARAAGEMDDARAARLDALNERLMHAANSTGALFISHTRLHNKFTLRLAVGNIRTTEEHVRRAWQLLNDTLHTTPHTTS